MHWSQLCGMGEDLKWATWLSSLDTTFLPPGSGDDGWESSTLEMLEQEGTVVEAMKLGRLCFPGQSVPDACTRPPAA